MSKSNGTDSVPLSIHVAIDVHIRRRGRALRGGEGEIDRRAGGPPVGGGVERAFQREVRGGQRGVGLPGGDQRRAALRGRGIGTRRRRWSKRSKH